MAIEEIQTRNGVRHIRETQREYRTEEERFVPPSEVGEVARSLITHLTQKEVAAELGYPPPRVSEAVRGERLSVALEIIEVYGGGEEAEGPLYRIPESVDALAHRREVDAREKAMEGSNASK